MILTLDKYAIYPEAAELCTRGTYGFEKIELSLSKDWDGLDISLCFYPPDKTEGVTVLYRGEPVDVPKEFTASGGYGTMTVVGSAGENIIISRAVCLHIINVPAPADAEPEPPTPSVSSQLREIAQKAESIALSVCADAEAGRFNGKSAYESAYSGGYAGTEAEFNAVLAGVLNREIGAYIRSEILDEAVNSIEYTNIGEFSEFDIILDAPAAAASTAYIYLTINGSKYSMLVGGFVKTNAPCQTSFTFRKIGDTWISMLRAGGSNTYIKISDRAWWDGSDIASFKLECYGSTVFPAGTKIIMKGI
ncbi:MAG: hypothetical protein VB118_04230 [Oscillospiraceae bacterium]|nr:hypothetical protein [Oscillospiraceae bacterium]